MDWYLIFDLTGTFLFAVSGTLGASNKKLDLFGALFTGFVTAIGGGTLRDLILDLHPLVWIDNYLYLIVIMLGALVAFIAREELQKLRKTLFLFDTLGIAFFTVVGLSKALTTEINIAAAVLMGMLSAVAGGLIRDTLINEIPLIFRKELYATACFLGAIVYIISVNLLNLQDTISLFLSMITTTGVRLIAIRYNIHLPLQR